MKLQALSINIRGMHLVIGSVVLLMSCDVMVMPGNLPSVKGIEPVSFAGVSLAIQNAEEDFSSYDIPTDTGRKLGFIGNRRAWTKKLIEALSGELAKRGAHVTPNAPLKLAVSLPKITHIDRNNFHEIHQFTVTVAIASSTGWSKNYEARAETQFSFFESADTMASRGAGLALAEAVKVILGDNAFKSQVRKK